jgi:putative spermidine/putrescine transport system permease protein
MTALVSNSRGAEGATPRRRGAPRSRGVGLGWIGLVPFTVYALLFLGIPAILAIASGFFAENGAFTLANFSTFAEPQTQKDIAGSIGLSAVSAVVGAIAGAVICYALLALRPDGWLRTIVDSASSVLAQFGGVMLAFAFIATMGNQGILYVVLNQIFGANTFSSPLYTVPGLTPVYLFFQIPLMVLTFMPAMEALKPAWGEAVATLGGTRRTYWWRVGIPVLAPAFFGCAILLFANSFSSFATAAALISQGGLLSLDIYRASTSETVLGHANEAGSLALAMVVVMIVLMAVYGLLQRRAARWGDR